MCTYNVSQNKFCGIYLDQFTFSLRFHMHLPLFSPNVCNTCDISVSLFFLIIMLVLFCCMTFWSLVKSSCSLSVRQLFVVEIFNKNGCRILFNSDYFYSCYEIFTHTLPLIAKLMYTHKQLVCRRFTSDSLATHEWLTGDLQMMATLHLNTSLNHSLSDCMGIE